MKRFELWGLTGGIASGKSTVARLFEINGIAVLDADQVARDLRQPGGAAHDRILKRFGTVDRIRLRELVFTDSKAKKDLEKILHPLIIKESKKRAAEVAKRSPFKNPVILYEGALLVETGRYRDMAGLIVVDAPREARLARLIQRDGHSPEMARRILDSQTGDEARIKAASYIIHNQGDETALQEAVQKAIKELGWR